MLEKTFNQKILKLMENKGKNWQILEPKVSGRAQNSHSSERKIQKKDGNMEIGEFDLLPYIIFQNEYGK